MGAKLDVRLRVLIPAVENSRLRQRPTGRADVFPSRKGLTVEIGNTDAEGRLVLADALADADDEAPELMIDMATLTGAARTATGFELPPFFTDDDALAADLMTHGAGGQRSAVAAAALARLRIRAQLIHRRPQQQSELRLRRRDHRGAVPEPLRGEGEELDASRHPRLGRPAASRPPRRRGGDHGPRPLLAAGSGRVTANPRERSAHHAAAGRRPAAQRVARGRVALRHEPAPDAVQDDELLFGETFTVFAAKDALVLRPGRNRRLCRLRAYHRAAPTSSLRPIIASPRSRRPARRWRGRQARDAATCCR